MREYFLSEEEKNRIAELQKLKDRSFNVGDEFYYLRHNKINKAIVESIQLSSTKDKVYYCYAEICFTSDKMFRTLDGLCGNLIYEYKFRKNSINK